MEPDLVKLRSDFDEFEVEIPMMMDDDLPSLLRISDKYKNVVLSFDQATINKVEQFYIDVLEQKESVAVSPARLNRIILAFIGEAVIHHGGGHWEFCDDLKHPGLGIPIVKGFKYDADDRGMLPAGVRERLQNTRKPGIIWNAVEACAYKDEQQKRLMDELKKLKKR